MGGHSTPDGALVKINVPRWVGVFCEVNRDLDAALGRKVAGYSAPDAAGPGGMPVDSWHYSLWETRVGGVSRSVGNWFSNGGVSLGLHEPRVAHLLSMVSIAAVVARILLRSLLFPLPTVFPGVVTSAVLILRLFLSAFPALAMLLLLLLLLPGALFPSTTSR